MAFFILLSWGFSAVTLGILAFGFFRRPDTLIRPTFVGATFLNLQTQWASATHSKQIWTTLESPWTYAAILHGVPFVAALLAVFSCRSFSVDLFRNVRNARVEFTPFTLYFLGLGLFGVSLVMSWYFYFVPLADTGLVRIFTDPQNAEIFRERSLKLLPSGTLQYAYSIASSTLIPLIAITAFLLSLQAFRKGAWGVGLATLGILPVLLFCLGIYGARGPAAMFVLGMVFVICVRYRERLTPTRLLLLGLAILALPTLLSLYRNGAELGFEPLAYHFKRILERVFGNYLTSLWHFQYVEANGFFGVGGMGNLARLFGVEPIPMFNLVGKAYVLTAQTTTLDSVMANAPFSVAIYACFGWWAIPLAFGCLAMMDAILLTLKRVHMSLLPATVATLMVTSTHLASTTFTTMLITYGFLLIPLTAWAFSASYLQLERLSPRLQGSTP